MKEIINKLSEIFEKNSNKRICILGSTCCGKSTLSKMLPNTIDMDEIL